MITMFRKMLRPKQQLPEADCIEMLKTEPRGVLSLLGDDDYPYGIPMNHWYNPNSRKEILCQKFTVKIAVVVRCLSKVLLQALARDTQLPPIEVSINFMKVAKKASTLANIAVVHHQQFKAL